MLDGVEYSSASECFVELNTTISSKRKKMKNKRRFSDEQIRSLEVMFETDTKLEPKKKAQLAKELGLQPRQIAIWFQNRRARWKSKQIEKDYTSLLSNYNSLATQFESLKKENQSLLSQLRKLKNEAAAEPGNKYHCRMEEGAGHSSTAGESEYTKIDFEVKNVPGILSDDDSSIKAELLVLDEENDLLKMVEPTVDSSLTSSEDWGTLDSDDLINQPAESYQWWDFWS